jgi:hypothetical protein
MTVTRVRVTDLLTPSVTRPGQLVRVDAPSPVRVEEPVRECFTRRIPTATTELQTLVNEYSHHLCVCSPNREDMLRARAEMQAHPGYAEYKARRAAAMAAHGGGK